MKKALLNLSLISTKSNNQFKRCFSSSQNNNSNFNVFYPRDDDDDAKHKNKVEYEYFKEHKYKKQTGLEKVKVIVERQNGAVNNAFDFSDKDLMKNVKIQEKNLKYEERAMKFAYKTFLPEEYPKSVSSEYLDFSKYQFIQGFCSSCNSVLCTQAVLVSMGLSVESAIGTSAVLSYSLKDFLGMLFRIGFIGKVGIKFDTSPKQWRLFADSMHNLSGAIEISLLFLGKSMFLPIAALASFCRGLSYTAGQATKAAFTKSFVQSENFADVTAKEGKLFIFFRCKTNNNLT